MINQTEIGKTVIKVIERQIAKNKYKMRLLLPDAFGADIELGNQLADENEKLETFLNTNYITIEVPVKAENNVLNDRTIFTIPLQNKFTEITVIHNGNQIFINDKEIEK
jgi:hypothetical protein